MSSNLFYVRFVPPKGTVHSYIPDAEQAKQFVGVPVLIYDEHEVEGKVECVFTDPEGYSVAVFSVDRQDTMDALDKGVAFTTLDMQYDCLELTGKSELLGVKAQCVFLTPNQVFAEKFKMGKIQRMVLG